MWKLLMISSLSFCLLSYAACKDCLLTNLCSCTFDDGSGKVDLTSLGSKNGTPRFYDVLNPDDGYYYSYSPCGGFKEGDCSNAAACVSNQNRSEQLQIGDASKAAFRWDDETGAVDVAYTSGSGILVGECECKERQLCAEIALQYVEEESVTLTVVNIIDPDYVTEMTLTTVCACAGMCDSNGPRGNCSGGGNSTSVCFTTSAEFTKRCHNAYDGKEEPIKVLIIDNWDGVCKFPFNTDVAVSLNNDKSTCEGVINRCNPKQSFSVNGRICKSFQQKHVRELS